MADLKLSDSEKAILLHGARHPTGTISKPMKRSNFDKPERRMAKLVEAGLVTPNAHGDWDITDAGRAAIAKAKGGA